MQVDSDSQTIVSTHTIPHMTEWVMVLEKLTAILLVCESDKGGNHYNPMQICYPVHSIN